jgi:predicted ATPase
MIKKVELTNFYGFGKTTIELHPEVNILVGINGSGKSNFLRALRILKEGVNGIGLYNYFVRHLGGFDTVYNRTVLPGELNSNKIELEFTFDTKKFKYKDEYEFEDDSLVYTITLNRKIGGGADYFTEESLWRSDGYKYFFSMLGFEEDGKSVYYNKGFDEQELMLGSIVLRNEDDFNALEVIKKNIKEIFVYESFDTSPNSGIRRMVNSNSTKALSLDGSNLTQLLNIIKINDKRNFRKIEELFKEVNPNFSGFDFHFIAGNIELQLEEREFVRSIPISNFSDGTLRYLCLLAIFFNSNRGNIVCIDEPELGLHPDMLLNIANTIKEISPETLFVISTHSENFLNYFEVENLKIFEKTDRNQTIIKSFSTDQFAEWYEDYTIGQMWKQGDFGGVRYGN